MRFRYFTAIISVLESAWLASSIALVARGLGHIIMAPLLFLVVFGWIARRCRMELALVGLAIAGLVFAVFLFPPVGSWQVLSASARTSLFWMALGGIALIYVLAPPRNDASGRRARDS